MKKCKVCQKVLAYEKFNSSPCGRGGVEQMCKVCKKVLYHQKNNPDGCSLYKKCSVCGELKYYTDYRLRNGKAGYKIRYSTCINCLNKRTKWMGRTKKGAAQLERIRGKRRDRYKVELLIPLIANKILEQNRRAAQKRRSTDFGRINKRMSERIRRTLRRGGKEGLSWKEYVNYSIDDLKKHIAGLFSNGMTWEKFLNGDIHIDHIKPISSYAYSDPHDDSFKECWALENLQPLWAKDNMSKGSRVNTKWQTRKSLQSISTCHQEG